MVSHKVFLALDFEIQTHIMALDYIFWFAGY